MGSLLLSLCVGVRRFARSAPAPEAAGGGRTSLPRCSIYDTEHPPSQSTAGFLQKR